VSFNLSRIGAIFSRSVQALYVLACIVLVLTTLSVCYEVVMRYFFGRAQIWVVESVSYSLLFITFLSASWVLKNEGHVKMDWLLNRLNPRNQALLNIITSILAAIVWLAIAWYGGQLTWGLYLEAVHIESELQPLKAPLVAIIPVGSFLLFIQLLRRAYGYLGSWRTALDSKRSGKR